MAPPGEVGPQASCAGRGQAPKANPAAGNAVGRKASNPPVADCAQDKIRMPHIPQPEKEIRGKKGSS